MITREQVADLQPGDVVELRCRDWHPDVAISGPVRHDLGKVQIGPVTLYWPKAGRDGEMFAGTLMEKSTLNVVSRAPCPLYVNHPRTEPADGDTVADEDNGGADWTWHRIKGTWYRHDGIWFSRDDMPARLRLLVDGETGRCVP